jgi:hypothetical protein
VNLTRELDQRLDDYRRMLAVADKEIARLREESPTYTDDDWERALEAAAQGLADAMGWHLTDADRAMARIVLTTARGELENPTLASHDAEA